MEDLEAALLVASSPLVKLRRLKATMRAASEAFACEEPALGQSDLLSVVMAALHKVEHL